MENLLLLDLDAIHQQLVLKENLDFENISLNFKKLADLSRVESNREVLRKNNAPAVGFDALERIMKFSSANDLGQNELKLLYNATEQNLRFINNCYIGEKDGDLLWAELEAPNTGLYFSPIFAFMSVLMIAVENNQSSNNQNLEQVFDTWEPIVSFASLYIDSFFDPGDNESVSFASKEFENVKICIVFLLASLDNHIFGESQESIFWFLYKLVEKSETVQLNIVENKMILPLLRLYERLLRLFKDPENENNDNLYSNIEENNLNKMKGNHIVYSKVAEATNSLFALISGQDQNMELLFQDKELYNFFLFNLDPSKHHASNLMSSQLIVFQGMALACLTILGNIARSDKNTEFYTNNELLSFVLEYWINRGYSIDVRTSYAAIGFLRNLCILGKYNSIQKLMKKNKKPLLEKGILNSVFCWMDSSISVLKLQTFAIYRHLLIQKGNLSDIKTKTATFFFSEQIESSTPTSENADSSSKTLPFKLLMDFLNPNSLSMESFEAIRLLINLLKVLMIDLDPKERDGFLNKMKDFDVITPICFIIAIGGSNHKILSLEGIEALLILCTFDQKAGRYAKKILSMLDFEFKLPSNANESDGLLPEEQKPETKKTLMETLAESSKGQSSKLGSVSHVSEKGLSSTEINEVLSNQERIITEVFTGGSDNKLSVSKTKKTNTEIDHF
ncbi:hypothetical protein BB560_001738 [Smittium megazygosporum]|uniref:Uncharacterized protein n=2 Tax=Smittium megazygosporum TaxID=133381 RepID=A0A2T9ZGP6_9FUNG|nr:hypothetical protein BB560_001738 [Smittium megazygosporum]